MTLDAVTALRAESAASARPKLGVPAHSWIGFGQVRHTRLKPQPHAFAYAGYFLRLPMRAMQAQGWGVLARNRFAPLSFYDADHGDARNAQSGGALAWLDELLEREGISDATGEVWLHCYPRVWGYAFKPVSFWYCHDAHDALRAIVVEVNNTFGERHCYLLDHASYGSELQARKVFHVSPFCPVEGGYRFRFMLSQGGRRSVARVDFDDAHGPLLQTSISGELQPLTASSMRRALWRYPAMTFGVVARIYWQALRLWWARNRLFSKPAAPEHFVTR